MNFIRENINFYLRDTSIENIFINEYMPTANGEDVKIYLYAYTHANEHSVLDNALIAKYLNIDELDVLKAWDYWEKQGLIKKYFLDHTKFNYNVEFVNLKQNFLGLNADIRNLEKDTPVTPEALVDASKDNRIFQMHTYIENLLQRLLSPNEMLAIATWMKDYQFKPEIIEKCYFYCVNKHNKRHINYVGSVIRTWKDKELDTSEKIDAFLDTSDKNYQTYRKIFIALGFVGRTASEHEKMIMNKWQETWKMDIDVILEACKKSSSTANPSINYIDGILTSWEKHKVHTLEDLRAMPDTKKNTYKASTPKQAKPNKFHNFSQRDVKLSDEEFNSLFRNNK